METKYLKINPADNVAVAIVTLPAGEKLTVVSPQKWRSGHS